MPSRGAAKEANRAKKFGEAGDRRSPTIWSSGATRSPLDSVLSPLRGYVREAGTSPAR
jgi:hypothetical protein